ncbi:DUF5615 family PIN-like protein [Candidatus Aerophobetes bacterium]|nr:DUF5615 family PIN-like protein [Candidatus Aerophobetes bacterium]
MHFLIDQDIYQVTIDYLIKLGHNVVTAREIGMHRASDRELLKKAKETNRIFITRDKDFGALVFIEKISSSGVILLRGKPMSINEIHKELKRVLREHVETQLHKYFCVVEPDKYRMRYIG